jgi:hypothetical protein
MAATPSEVEAARQYLVTKGLKLSPHKFAASHKELGNKSFDETLEQLKSIARGPSDQEQELKERVDTAVRTETK